MDRPTTRPNLVGPTPGSAHLVQGVTAPQAAHSAVTAGAPSRDATQMRLSPLGYDGVRGEGSIPVPLPPPMTPPPAFLRQ